MFAFQTIPNSAQCSADHQANELHEFHRPGLSKTLQSHLHLLGTDTFSLLKFENQFTFSNNGWLRQNIETYKH